MLLSTILPLSFAVQACLVLAHSHFETEDALHLYRRRYAMNHRALITNCGDKVRARQLKRALSPFSELHPVQRGAVLARNNSTSTSTNTTTSSCVLDGEVTQGPYHVMGELIRQNITEGLAGVPVTYEVDFVDWSTCEPLKNAWIDLWHANSTGENTKRLI